MLKVPLCVYVHKGAIPLVLAQVHRYLMPRAMRCYIKPQSLQREVLEVVLLSKKNFNTGDEWSLNP